MSPYEKADMEYFPLVKAETEVGKKSRRYRGVADRGKSHATQDKERSNEHRKHKSSERERRNRPPRSLSPGPFSSSSAHKSRGIRRNVSSGHTSPRMYEGKRSRDYQSRDQRNLPHNYKSDREDVYRRGERMRHPKEHYHEGRRGSGAPPPDLHAPRAHRDAQGRSRSPLMDEMRRHRREGREHERMPMFGGGRGREGQGYVHERKQVRRQRPLVAENQYVGTSSEGSSGEEGGGRRPPLREQRVFTLRHEDFQSILEGEGRNREGGGSSTESSEDSGSVQGEEVRGGEGRKEGESKR